VRAASADALVPVASELLALGPTSAHTIRTLLWSLLAELDELSPAIASVVQLLSHLYSQAPPPLLPAQGSVDVPADSRASAVGGSGGGGGAAAVSSSGGGGGGGGAPPLNEASSKELTHQLPRLWPYLRHGLSEWEDNGVVLLCCA